MLSITCLFTRYTVFKALKSASAEAVAQGFKAFMWEYTTPRKVLLDNGKPFVHKLFRLVCEGNGVAHMTAPLCSP